MYFSPGGKVASHAEAGMLSVLEGIGNNHENKQGVVYEAHGRCGRRGPLSPEKSSFSQCFGLPVSLLEGNAFSLGCSGGGEGRGIRRGTREECGPSAWTTFCTLWKKGDKYSR